MNLKFTGDAIAVCGHRGATATATVVANAVPNLMVLRWKNGAE